MPAVDDVGPRSDATRFFGEKRAMAMGNDRFPSGSWGLGPLNLQWSLKAANEVDVDISVFGIDIDQLTGTINQANTKISDAIDVLGIVKGTLAVEAKYGQGPVQDGVWLEGQLTGPGFDTGQMNIRIVSW